MDEKLINKFLLQSRYITISSCPKFSLNRSMGKKHVFDSRGLP